MSKLQNQTAIQAIYNDVLYIHTGFAAIMSSAFFNKTVFKPPKELWEAYSNCFVYSSVRLSVRQSIHPASCPVHISYILWGRNSKFGVWMHIEIAKCLVTCSGHCDLDLDIWVFRIIVSGAYLLYYLRLESQIWYVDASWDESVAHHLWVPVTLTLTSDLVSRICFESGAYPLYSLR